MGGNGGFVHFVGFAFGVCLGISMLSNFLVGVLEILVCPVIEGFLELSFDLDFLDPLLVGGNFT